MLNSRRECSLFPNRIQVPPRVGKGRVAEKYAVSPGAEYERYGGPHLEPSEMLLKYHLQWPSFAMDACQWVDRDIYVQCPREATLSTSLER